VNLLVIGGSGHVGSLVLPYLISRHTVRGFDLLAPACEGIEYIPGSVCDFEALSAAVGGMDAVLYMAMGSHRRIGWDDWATLESRVDAFDVNIKGVHLALFAAHSAGIKHMVYTSSMSVYHDTGIRRAGINDDTPADSDHIYGLTKRLGEDVCQSACQAWGMSVNALRLCLPVPEADWLAKTYRGEPTIMTTAQDTADALLKALEFRDGFQTFTISGDYQQKLMSLEKAKRLLDWAPTARPRRRRHPIQKIRRFARFAYHKLGSSKARLSRKLRREK